MQSVVSTAELVHAREFLEFVRPLQPGYGHGAFSYVSVVHNGEPVLLGARLDLLTSPPQGLKRSIATASVSAGQILLSPLAPSVVERCIQAAATGASLHPLSDWHFKLLAQEGGSRHFDADFLAPTGWRLREEGHIGRLVLSGIDRSLIIGSRYHELHRELRQIGIDSIEDLMCTYEMSDGGSGRTRLEIVAHPMVVFARQSGLEGRRVRLRFERARGLDPAALTIAVRNATPGVSALPMTADLAQITWIGDTGECEFTLSNNAIVECWATYAGHIQAQVRLWDPKAWPNARRMLVDLVDPDSRFERLIRQPKKEESRDFEAAIGWLMQLLGFAPLQLSAMSYAKNEPDILAVAPSGAVLVIECTVDVPDDDKLSKLISRVARFRERFDQAQWLEVRTVVALLIAPLLPAELAGIRAKAEEHAIILLCRPELDAALERAKFAPDANAVLQSWERLDLNPLLTGERALGGS